MKSPFRLLGSIALFGAIIISAAQSLQAANCDFLGCSNTFSCRKTSNWFAPTTYGGWLEAGFFANEYGQRTSYDPASLDRNHMNPVSGNTDLLANVRQTGVQLNQLWLFAEKELNTDCGWDFGYRVDAIYGTDGRFLQSIGDESFDYGMRSGDYYTAIGQLYFQGGYRNTRFMVGKFESPIGYSAARAPDRFFYSQSYSYDAAANVHGGALGFWDVNDKITLSGGWVNGLDKTFANLDDNAFLGGIEYHLTPRATLAYNLIAGDDRSDFSDLGTYYQHTFLFLWDLNRCWNYVFEWTLTDYENMGGAYGINQELIYRINPCWALGGRFEWLRSNNLEADLYELTFGLNWTPTKCFLLRPEIRYDTISQDDAGLPGPFDGTRTGKDHQFSGGCSAVFIF